MSMWASSTRKCRLSVDLIKWSICTCFVRFIGKTWITAVRVKLKRKQKHTYTDFGARYRSLKRRYEKYFRRTLFEFHIFRLKYRLQCFVVGFCLSLTLSFSPTPCPSLPQSSIFVYFLMCIWRPVCRCLHTFSNIFPIILVVCVRLCVCVYSCAKPYQCKCASKCASKASHNKNGIAIFNKKEARGYIYIICVYDNTYLHKSAPFAYIFHHPPQSIECAMWKIIFTHIFT